MDTKRGKQLTQEIDIFIKQRQKQNKILAKNVAEWVDQAMTINTQLKQGGAVGANGELEDFDLEDFDDDDDNDGEKEEKGECIRVSRHDNRRQTGNGACHTEISEHA